MRRQKDVWVANSSQYKDWAKWIYLTWKHSGTYLVNTLQSSSIIGSVEEWSILMTFLEIVCNMIFRSTFVKQVYWESLILLIKTAPVLLICNWICGGQACLDDHPWHLFQCNRLFWVSFVKQVSWESFILLIKTTCPLDLSLDLWRTGVSWRPSMTFILILYAVLSKFCQANP